MQHPNQTLNTECCWLVVFYVPSTARSFRDGTPIYCPFSVPCEGREARFPHESNPDRCVAVHYTTAVPHQLHQSVDQIFKLKILDQVYMNILMP